MTTPIFFLSGSSITGNGLIENHQFESATPVWARDARVADGNVPISAIEPIFGPLILNGNGVIDIASGGALSLEPDSSTTEAFSYSGLHSLEVGVENTDLFLDAEYANQINGVYTTFTPIVAITTTFTCRVYGTGTLWLEIQMIDGSPIVSTSATTEILEWHLLSVTSSSLEVGTLYRLMFYIEDTEDTALYLDSIRCYYASFTDIFLINQITGLHMPPVEDISSPYALKGGSHSFRSRLRDRTITLSGTIIGNDNDALRDARATLFRLFNPDIQSEPVPFICQPGDDDTSQLSLEVLYKGGLEDGGIGYLDKNVSIKLQAPSPYWYRAESTHVHLENTNGIMDALSIMRFNGVWSDLAGVVRWVSTKPGGRTYLLEDGGIWWLNDDGEQVLLTTTPYNARLLLAAGSRYYIADRSIDYWNGTSWTDIVTPNWYITMMAIGGDGYLYTCGSDEAVQEVFSYWNGTSWTAVSPTPLADGIFGVLADTFGDIIFWGRLYPPGTAIGKYSTQTRVLTYPFGNVGMAVTMVASDNRGYLYAVGYLTSLGDDWAVKRYTGEAWETLGVFTSDLADDLIMRGLAVDDQYNIHVSGKFKIVYGRSSLVPDVTFSAFGWHAVVYRGFQWVVTDADIEPYGVWTAPGVVIYGPETDDGLPTTLAAGTTIITNTGEQSPPIITITGPGDVIQLTNYTTGDVIYFRDCTLVAGEVLTIDFRPDKHSITSSVEGNALHHTLPGSSLSWLLAPGENIISLYAGTFPTVTATIQWYPRYLSGMALGGA